MASIQFFTQHSGRLQYPAGRQCGFTVIEVLMAVVILGVLVTLAIPNLTSLVRDQRVKTAIGDVYASIIFARSEAIKRSANVVICTSGDWASGWSVKTVDCSGTELKRQDAFEGINIVQSDGSAVGNATFLRDGRLSASLPIVVVKSSENTTVKARCLRMDPSGRPNIQVDTNPSVAGCQS